MLKQKDNLKEQPSPIADRLVQGQMQNSATKGMLCWTSSGVRTWAGQRPWASLVLLFCLFLGACPCFWRWREGPPQRTRPQGTRRRQETRTCHQLPGLCIKLAPMPAPLAGGKGEGSQTNPSPSAGAYFPPQFRPLALHSV
jgi:hypothetical protein